MERIKDQRVKDYPFLIHIHFGIDSLYYHTSYLHDCPIRVQVASQWKKIVTRHCCFFVHVITEKIIGATHGTE